MIAVCLKFSAPPGHDLDDRFDDRFAGVSAADRAALEVALRLARPDRLEVLAVAAGPPGSRRVLREALACGATRAVHIEASMHRDSRQVARDLADVVGDADIVLCGDYSVDRGSGSVPAFIAHHLGAAQALGLVGVDTVAADAAADSVPAAVADRPAGVIRALRRLDGGRREVLDVPTPCVLSVEGSVATLRRSSLSDALASATAKIEVRSPSAPTPSDSPPATWTTAPFRPRARALPAPSSADALGRLRSLTDAVGTSSHGDTIELDPRASAAAIVDSLRRWGYVD